MSVMVSQVSFWPCMVSNPMLMGTKKDVYVRSTKVIAATQHRTKIASGRSTGSPRMER